MYKNVWYCRWCGITYAPNKQTERDGFCSTRHKQALHRAHKKYVTAKSISAAWLQLPSVTPSKAKKKGKTNAKTKKEKS